MKGSARAQHLDRDAAAGVLAAAMQEQRAAQRHEVNLMLLAVDWAAMHSADSLDPTQPAFADQMVELAGDGSPGVSQFAVAELSVALSMSPQAGGAFLADALELRYRLPCTWARLTEGALPPWRARRVARGTMWLPADAAAFVDRNVAPVAHSIPPAQLQRLVEEAHARFDPEGAWGRAQAAADRRHATVHTDELDLHTGTVPVTAHLTLEDGLTLDAALADRARELKTLGSTDTLDGRRATALGDLGRAQLSLELHTAPAARASRPARKIVLYLHLSDAALLSGSGVGQLANTRQPVPADLVRAWCGNADQVVVSPVIDLKDRVWAGSYQVPDRIRERIRLRDPVCVFPHCNEPAVNADLDHVVPHDWGGETSTDNLVPLCRRHHRVKTHAGWRLSVLAPGDYLWRTNHGLLVRRDHRGTHAVAMAGGDAEP